VRGADNAGREGVYAVNLSTGEATAITDATAAGATPLSLVGRTAYRMMPFKKDEPRLLGAVDLDTRVEREVARLTDGAAALIIGPSPGNSQLAYLDSTRAARVWLVDLPSGSPRLLFTPPGAQRTSSCAWHASGEGLWCATFARVEGVRHEELWAVPLGGEPRTTDLQGDFTTLAAHPDGKRIAYTSSSPSKTEVLMIERFLPAAAARPVKR
jgi:hypothetical protein